MSFNFVAPFYDFLARLVFGQTLKNAQSTLLPHLPFHASILVIGGGSGWILEQVLTRCNPQFVLYLEASERMMAMAKQKTSQHPKRERVIFRCGTENDLQTDECFDVLITPFVLDLFPEEVLMSQLIPRLQNTLHPGGYWLVTDFVPTRIGWHKLLTRAMYGFFRLMAGVKARRLPNWPMYLSQYSTLTFLQVQTFWQGFICSRLYQRSK